MDNSLNKTNIYATKTAVDDFFEEKTEFDIVIPDYSPSAARILSCNVVPLLLSHSEDAERLSADIQCKAHVVYVDDDGMVHSVSKTETIRRAIPITVELCNYRIKSGIRPISVNCRLQNTRRVTVRAVIGVALKLIGNKEIEVIGANESLQSVYQNVTSNTFSGYGETSLCINGSISVAKGISEIIRSGGSISVTDVKPVNSKVIVKGEADIHIVYVTGDGTDHFCFAECSIPFSDVIDVPETVDDSIAQVNGAVNDIRCEVDSESGEVTVEVDTMLYASVYSLTETILMSDAYSMTEEIAVEHTDVAIESLCEHGHFSETVTGSFASDMENARIIGMSADPVIKSISIRDGKLSVDGDMSVTVYMCNDNEYCLSDKSVPFSFLRKIPDVNGSIRCEASAVVRTISFTMPDDKNVSISAAVDVDLSCFNTEIYSVVNNVKKTDTQSPDACKGIVLYNAEKGESLWDIAKKYRSSVEILKRDNNIEQDIMSQSKMILIAFN